MASAEFDFQLQTRFNPQSAVVTRFTHAVPDDANGFYVAGSVGADGFIGHFDANRNLIASQRWDHPGMGVEIVENLVRDPAGRLTVTFLPRDEESQGPISSLAIVRYTSALQKTWEYSGSVASNQLSRNSTDVLPTGETGIAYMGGGTATIRILSASGAVLASPSFSDVTMLYDVCAVPTPDGTKGFAICGRKSGKGWVARVNVAGEILYETLSATSGDVLRIVGDETGVVSGIGQNPVQFFHVTAGGSMTAVVDGGAKLGQTAWAIDLLDGGMTRARLNDEVVEFNRTTLALTGRYSTTVSLTSAVRHGSGPLLGGSHATRFEKWATPGFTQKLTTGMDSYAGINLSGDSAQFVGWNESTNRAAISLEPGSTSVPHEEFALAGYSHRTYVDSALGQNGDIALLSDTTRRTPNQVIPYPGILTVYNLSSQLKFARALTGVVPRRLLALESGNFAVMGVSSINDDLPSISLVNAQGTLTLTRVFNFSAPLVASRIAPISGSDEVLLMVVRSSGKMALCRVRPNGSFAYNIGYSESLISSKLIGLPQGNAFMAQVLDGITVLRRINAETGLPELSRTITGETLREIIDLPGSAVALVTSSSGAVRIRRLDEGTLLTTHTAELAGRTFDAIGVGPTGRIALATREGSVGKGMVYNGADLAPVHAELDLPTAARDAMITNTNHAYFLGSSWASKFTATGSFVKEQQPEGSLRRIFPTTSALWVTGDISTRYKGSGPLASRYSR